MIRDDNNNVILVGYLEHFLFSHLVGNVIIPIDFHIFQRGRYTTNQNDNNHDRDPQCHHCHVFSVDLFGDVTRVQAAGVDPSYIQLTVSCVRRMEVVLGGFHGGLSMAMRK